jgi:hypothetical protein
MKAREKMFIFVVYSLLAELYLIAGYYYELPLAPPVQVRWQPLVGFWNIFVILAVLGCGGLWSYFRRDGKTYETDDVYFYGLSLLISWYGYANMWFGREIFSLILWTTGFIGVVYVYLRGRLE